jgi:hypothetical protein
MKRMLLWLVMYGPQKNRVPSPVTLEQVMPQGIYIVLW